MLIVLVQKRNGKIRMIIDYSTLSRCAVIDECTMTLCLELFAREPVVLDGESLMCILPHPPETR